VGGYGSRFTTKKKAVSQFSCLKKGISHFLNFTFSLDSNKNNIITIGLLRVCLMHGTVSSYALSSLTSLPGS
jgi:hypothetical protein